MVKESVFEKNVSDLLDTLDKRWREAVTYYKVSLPPHEVKRIIDTINDLSAQLKEK
jgi:hypothetical protein